MKRDYIYISLIVVLGAVIFTAFATSGSDQKVTTNDRTGYIVMTEVFQEFQGTKELRDQLSKSQEKQKSVLDSLELQINMMIANKADRNEIIGNQQLYNQLLEEFTKNSQEQSSEYDNEIWKQINQYVQDYGKEKGYAYIHGASGQGNLMYADESKNVTKEVVEYINSKYKGY